MQDTRWEIWFSTEWDNVRHMLLPKLYRLSGETEEEERDGKDPA